MYPLASLKPSPTMPGWSTALVINYSVLPGKMYRTQTWIASPAQSIYQSMWCTSKRNCHSMYVVNLYSLLMLLSHELCYPEFHSSSPTTVSNRPCMVLINLSSRHLCYVDMRPMPSLRNKSWPSIPVAVPVAVWNWRKNPQATVMLLVVLQLWGNSSKLASVAGFM